MTFIANCAFMGLTTLLDSAEKLITRWQGWFMRRDGVEHYMNSNVLTDNSWLYAGLAALLPEMVCLQAGFCAHRLPREARRCHGRIIQRAG